MGWPEDKPNVRKAKVEIDKVEVFMPTSYARGQDAKMGLQQLQNTRKHTKAALQLRNSNILQRECLNKPFQQTTEACRIWRKCLKRKKAEAQIEVLLELLDAAGVVGNGNVTSENITNAPHCIYPPTEDPEGWNCDCFEEMHQRCRHLDTANLTNFSQTLCLRAVFCTSTRVCSTWRAEMCNSPEVLELMAALDAESGGGQGDVSMFGAQSMPRKVRSNARDRSISGETTGVVALLERGQHGRGTQEGLENSLGNKHCV